MAPLLLLPLLLFASVAISFACPEASPCTSQPTLRPTPIPEPAPTNLSPTLLQNLTGFSLQLPVTCKAANNACSKTGAAIISPINSFTLAPYFYIKGSALVMRADTTGLTTPGSMYARTELADGRNWNLKSVGTARLSVTLSVDVEPTATGGDTTDASLFPSPPFPRPGPIVIGQIKGSTDGEIELRYELGHVFLQVLTASRPQFYLLTNSSNKEADIRTGDVFSYMLQADAAGVKATVLHQGRTYAHTLDTSSLSHFNQANPVYFKAGAYVQVHDKASGAPRIGKGFGQVSILSIATSFAAKSGLLLATVDPGVLPSSAACTWPGHCAGAACSSSSQCSDFLVCIANKCAMDAKPTSTPITKPKPSPAPIPAPTPTTKPKPTPAPTPAPTASSGCPAGWLPAVGTVYESWPKPGSSECLHYDGCLYAGQFNNIDSGGDTKASCRNGAQWLDGGNGNFGCRFSDAKVRAWDVASTYEKDPGLLNKQIKVMVQGKASKTATVNMVDVCRDSDCSNCCKQNTGNKRYPLIDMEKWTASGLLDFDPNNIDVNTYKFPPNNGQRPGAPASVIPLCYQVMGPAPRIP